VLRRSIEASGRALEALFRQGLEKGKIKNTRPHLMGFFGYVIAHEWYHVGEVCMTLEQAGHPLPDQVLYAIWEWGKR
jgi:uncharacterized damage-inducible protein DinB